MKFEIGQLVRIKINANEIEEPEREEDKAGRDFPMEAYLGRVCRIKSYWFDFYSLDVDEDYVWNEVWLEPVIDEKDIFLV